MRSLGLLAWSVGPLLLCGCARKTQPGATQVLGVSVAPNRVELQPLATQQFAATVVGSQLSTLEVRWLVQGIPGGDDSVGTITDAGLYTAPRIRPATGQVALTAVSAADPAKQGTAQIVLQPWFPPITVVAVLPGGVTLRHGQRQQFTAPVVEPRHAGVTWSVTARGQAPAGTIDATGLYTAPSSGDCSDLITATSVLDPTAMATATVLCASDSATLVSVSPAGVDLYAGEEQVFSAAVSSSPDQRVTWSVAGSVPGAAQGFIDSTGRYRAPLTGGCHDVVTATSLIDPSASGTATVRCLSNSGATVTVAPASVLLAHGAQQQFAATVTGAPGVVWSAAGPTPFDKPGTIGADGLYTAPSSGPCGIVVTATAVGDATATGTALVSCIPDTPVITALNPNQGNVGDRLVISGTAFRDGTDFRVVFTGDGVPIRSAGCALTACPGPQVNQTGTVITVSVPAGVSSGTLSVETVTSLGVLRSNAVAFTRIPRLRLLPASREVAAGESVAVHARVLGAEAAQLAWSADLGSVAPDGTFTAPSPVSAEAVATVTACAAGTSACQTTHVRVHPFRIDPFRAALPLGGAMQLAARQGGSTATASWELWGPAGALSADGSYTAGAGVRSGGAIAIHADLAGLGQTAWLGVTGAAPGEIARLYDFMSGAATDYADSAALGGGRLFALFADAVQPYSSQSRFFLDTYDVTDPTRPAWVDSLEPAMRPDEMWLEGDKLFLLSSANVQNDVQPALATYDVSSGKPVLASYTPLDRGWIPQPQSQGNGRRDGDRLRYCQFHNDGDPYARCSELGLADGVRTDYLLPVPASYGYAQPGFARVGSTVYLFAGGGGGLSLATYDASVHPAAPLASQVLPKPPSSGPSGGAPPEPFPLTDGSLLVAGGYLFDVSGTGAVLKSILPCPTVLAWDGARLAGIGPFGDLRVFDLTDPARPAWLSSFAPEGLEIDVYLPLRPRLAGDLLLLPGGRRGLSLVSVAEAGGLLEEKMTGDPGSAVYEQALYQGLLYSAEVFGVGGELVVWDTNADPSKDVFRFPLGSETPYSVLVANGHLLLGTDASLRIFDLASPAAPVLVGSAPVPAAALAASGTLLFASTAENKAPELAVLDLGDPKAPQTLARLALPGLPIRFALAGTILYAAADTAGLLVIDVSQPAAPRLLSQWTPSPHVEDVALDGSLALLAAGEQGLLLADVTTPSAPVALSATTLPSFDASFTGFTAPQPGVLSVALRNGYAYLGTIDDFGRAWIYDYRSVAHPRPVSVTRARGLFADSFIDSFAFDGDHAFYAGWNDDDDGTTSPGSVASDAQPANIVLMHPLLLESIATTAGPGHASPARRQAPPLHPKLRAPLLRERP
jgi:hypothetical protein